MITLQGKFNTADVYTDNIESEAISQIINLLNQSFVEGSKIRIMPDTHAGAGCTIGTTMTINDMVCPNIVGVDIGCGMLVINMGKIDLHLPELDFFIRNHIPHGFKNNENVLDPFDFSSLACLKSLSKESSSFQKAIGSLGGGNHFVEVNADEEGNLYLVIHTGSRNLGLQVANHWQKVAIKERAGEGVPDVLAYLKGDSFHDYINDMMIAQNSAQHNRAMIAHRILNHLKLRTTESTFETVHNYINMTDRTLRKGAISAKKGEVVIIPMNMQFGSIIAIGKGFEEANQSAPHGAGRIMSRTKAKANLSMDDFTESMKGIYTSSVGKNTLDEAPQAYKPPQEIIDNIKDMVDIINIIKPVYNFKAE